VAKENKEQSIGGRTTHSFSTRKLHIMAGDFIQETFVNIPTVAFNTEYGRIQGKDDNKLLERINGVICGV
jgi:hypothetical protein